MGLFGREIDRSPSITSWPQYAQPSQNIKQPSLIQPIRDTLTSFAISLGIINPPPPPPPLNLPQYLLKRMQQVVRYGTTSLAVSFNKALITLNLKKKEIEPIATPKRSPTIMKVAKVYKYVAVAFVIFAGVYGTGALMTHASTMLKNDSIKATSQLTSSISSLMGYVGQGLTSSGKFAMEVIAVPHIIVFYNIPKWIWNEGLPIVVENMQAWIKTAIDFAVKGIEWLSENILVYVKTALESTFEFFVNCWESLREVVINVVTRVVNWVVKPIMEFAANVVESIADFLKSSFEMIISCFGRIFSDYVQPIFMYCWNGLVGCVNSITHLISTTLNDYILPMLNAIVNRIIPVLTAIKDLTVWSFNQFISLANAISDAGVALINACVSIIEKINSTIIQPIWNHVTSVVIYAKDIIAEKLNQGIDLVFKSANWMIEKTSNAISYLANTAFDIVRPVYNFVKEGVSAVANSALTAANWAWTHIVVPPIETAWKGISLASQFAMTLAEQGIQAASNILVSIGNNIMKVVGGFVDHVLSPIIATSFDFIAWIGSRVSSMLQAVHTNIIIPVFETSKEVATSVMTWISEIGPAIANAISNAIDVAYNDVTAFFAKFRS